MHLFSHISCCVDPLYLNCYPIHPLYDPYYEHEEMVRRACHEAVISHVYPRCTEYPRYAAFPRYPRYEESLGYPRYPRYAERVDFNRPAVYNGHEHGKG